ncbi:ACP S-malonyltransferase [Streptomyces sp. NBC_01485]|uniref:ACP S-malonyltransferase n=1 Tax=Streptomyces sp. NBC_01485 TaxID=2903884 RepID=UPI002E2F627A|nr:ACP S-malonyltransferase [Streptomyces sp. NBC_01485]
MGPRVWLFPGQGAQRRGMGRELFDRFPEAAASADAILGFSVRELCLQDPEGRLTDTRFLQPALFVVNELTRRERAARDGVPDFLAGHSLGEYNALLAGGAFDFETGLRLVARRGELMSQAPAGGGMSAVIGPGVDRVPDFLAGHGLDDVDVANFNSARQIVLSGPLDSVRRATDLLRAEKLGRGVPLRVSTAFHSRYMAQAAAEFEEFLAGFELRDPRLPVIANVTAMPYRAGTVRRLLAAQVRSSVRWSESMDYLLGQGVRESAELGPGRVLTGLWEEAVKTAAEKPAATPVPAVVTAVPAAEAVAAIPPRPVRPLPAAPSAPPRSGAPVKAAERLGSAAFRADYGVRYAYLAGSMFKGVASTALVVRMARAGLLGFFGAGGLSLDRVESAIRTIRQELGPEGRFGMNLLHAMHDPAIEADTVRLYLRHDIRFVEAAGFMQLTPALVHYRLSGAYEDREGRPAALRRVVAKVSRPEVAGAFMAPAPESMVRRLVAEGSLTETEARLGLRLPVSEDICVEADSGGHTDAGVAYALMPAMTRLRDRHQREHAYTTAIRVGAAGGLGSPESLAAAFVLGADFVLTGSVNQCSPEAGTSDAVKELLAGADVQDTGYAPAGDMFEIGARVQVLRRGSLFCARASKLYQTYRQYDSLDAIDGRLRRTIEETYFRRGFDQVWKETREYYLRVGRSEEVKRAESDPKHLMALVFRWYFVHSTRLAMDGDDGERANFQIHTGPAMGAFNRFVRDTSLQDWRNRHVDAIAEALMNGAAEVLRDRLASILPTGSPAQK